MKNSLFSILITLLFATAFSFTLTSCGESKKTEEAVEEIVYACPMHPEVTGKENDTCSKCGMAREKVEKAEEVEMDHGQH